MTNRSKSSGGLHAKNAVGVKMNWSLVAKTNFLFESESIELNWVGAFFEIAESIQNDFGNASKVGKFAKRDSKRHRRK